MLIDKCPHCDTSHVQTTPRFNEVFHPGDNPTVWHVLRCQNPACQKLVLACTVRGQITQILPAGRFELDAGVPVSQEIRDDFREAGLSLGAGCFRASMVMSRRVLQRCLKDQGCTERNLVDAIRPCCQPGHSAEVISCDR